MFMLFCKHLNELYTSYSESLRYFGSSPVLLCKTFGFSWHCSIICSDTGSIIELVFKSCMLQTLHNSMTSFYYIYRLCLNLPTFAVIFIVQLWNHKFNNYRTHAYLMFLTRPFFSAVRFVLKETMNWLIVLNTRYGFIDNDIATHICEQTTTV